jgi:protein arginine N-methyltransferase 5
MFLRPIKRDFLSYPAHISLLFEDFFKIGAQVVINATSYSEDLKYYHQYIDFLWNNARQEDSSEDNLHGNFSRGYEDFLQCPLQPLMDNLESHTYEVFEKDPIKYTLYETAIYEALLSRSDQNDRASRTFVIMVVGAGRGPLVHAALNAANKAEQNVTIYAIEKNANAINTLLHLKKRTWIDKDINIVWTDMRSWTAPEKADLMISELLGSFGDNELSPECLDGAQNFLRDDGIMIPQSYTSFIAPIMSAKLYSEVRSHRDGDRHPNAHFETPFVVHMHNKYTISPPQALFTFDHPNKDTVKDNDRYCIRKFNVEQDCVFHGFAGYFESVLFGNVLMSTHPDTHSPGMFSWFPIYFPVRDPTFLRKSDTLTASFWRKSSKANVWYEWGISTPVALPIHNVNGKSYNIGLQGSSY